MSIYTYDYEKLMSEKPTEYDRMTNSKNQEIVFYEHPTLGDTSFVICVCHAMKLAEDSTFFELDDMTADHREYEPSFQDGKLFIGDFAAND